MSDWIGKALLVRNWIVVLAVTLVLVFSVAGHADEDQNVRLEAALLTQEKWLGDFDGMVKRRQIRVLVVYSKTFYFLDRGHQRGATYEGLKLFEKFVNQKLKTKTLKIEVIPIPVKRDELIPGLLSGRGDIAAANLTGTDARREKVAFSKPFATGVKELLVTGPAAPAVKNTDDLAGQEIHVRPSSSYYESLVAFNQRFIKAGRSPVKIVAADELFEDEDLLEMVNAGLIPMIIMDSHKAEFWQQIFENIKVHPNISVRDDGHIAWAFRKDSPKLSDMVNQFVKKNKTGTLHGNIILKRYLKDTKYVKNALANNELPKFKAVVALFKEYAGQYDFDFLMIAAQAYQESGLDHSVRSPAGAVGIMQLLPSTAKDPNVGIPDIEKIEKNIQAGSKYMRFIIDRYFQDPQISDLNKVLFGFAAYNAGPARVSGLRRKAARMGLDPNQWFHNVEVVAAKEIGRETVQYVSNIYKYYIAYRKVVDKLLSKETLLKTS